MQISFCENRHQSYQCDTGDLQTADFWQPGPTSVKEDECGSSEEATVEARHIVGASHLRPTTWISSTKLTIAFDGRVSGHTTLTRA
jgi:hypothetical protein